MTLKDAQITLQDTKQSFWQWAKKGLSFADVSKIIAVIIFAFTMGGKYNSAEEKGTKALNEVTDTHLLMIECKQRLIQLQSSVDMYASKTQDSISYLRDRDFYNAEKYFRNVHNQNRN